MHPLQSGIEEILADLKRRTSRGFSDDEVRALLTRRVRYALRQAASECENQHLGCQGRHECHDWDAREIKDLLPS